MNKLDLTQRLVAYFYVAAAIGLAIAVSIPFLRKTDSQFDNVYLRAAHRLQTGADIYPLEDGYLYPPLMAWMAIPLTWVTPAVARIIWLAINLTVLAFVLAAAWRLSGGKGLKRFGDPREHLILWLGLACALRYALDCLQNQQTDIVVIGLVLAGCCLLPSDSSPGNRLSVLGAVVCFGLAAAMKCTPLLFAPYLLWRRRWISGLSLAALALGLNLLPNLTSTPPEGGWWLGEWTERYLAVLARSDHHPGVWGSAVTLNQSWSGAVYRWLATTWTWDAHGVSVVPVSPLLTPTAMKLLVYGSELTALLVIGFLAYRPRKPLENPKADALRTLEVEAQLANVEYATVLTLMVLLSPMSSKPHFLVLLVPAWLLARRAVNHQDRVSLAILGLAILAGGLTIKDLAGTNLATLAMWFGGVTWSAILLLAGAVLLLRRQRRTPERVPESDAIGSGRATPGPRTPQRIGIHVG